MKKAKIAVLISGTGSLLIAMLEKGLDVSLVLADKDCEGVEKVIVRFPQVKIEMVRRTDFGKPFESHRAEFTKKVVEVLQANDIKVVVMAGFMTIFSKEMFDAYSGRVLNSHPALLPAFKGPRVVADALAFGVKITGTTIHIATAELDAGPILAQEAVRILEGDTEATLWERIKVVERTLYYETVLRFMAKNFSNTEWEE